jgi:hypothetical protein
MKKGKSTIKEKEIKIKVAHLVYFIVIVAVFSVGFYLRDFTGYATATTEDTSLVDDCKDFCSIMNTNFSHIEGDECFCKEDKRLSDFQNNRTISYTQIFSAGRIRNLEISSGIDPRVVEALRQEILRQQKIQQQQQQLQPKQQTEEE